MEINEMTGRSGRDATPKGTKLASMLANFMAGMTLNRFDAERHYDHCLHSTVSSLESYGLVFERRWETVPCVSGTKRVRCKRYWLSRAAENVNLARALLAKWGLI